MSGLIPFNRNRSMLRTTGFEDFYNMLDDFFNDIKPSTRSLVNDSFKIDVRENENDYCIDAELPGVKKEEIKIELNDGKFSIAVQREENIDEKKDNYLHRERRFGSMRRSVYLADVKSEGIVAKFDNGLLEVTVPKKSLPEKTQQIQIQ
ncbi:MAG: Hsp20/alpha crystallin family protein [Syntrophomonadaceae bacterium]|nr:Hsp20/alpha crystallin family protein [Syntrophomonadaceae bacterium]